MTCCAMHMEAYTLVCTRACVLTILHRLKIILLRCLAQVFGSKATNASGAHGRRQSYADFLH